MQLQHYCQGKLKNKLVCRWEILKPHTNTRMEEHLCFALFTVQTSEGVTSAQQLKSRCDLTARRASSISTDALGITVCLGEQLSFPELLKRFILYSLMICFYKTSFKSFTAAISGLPGRWTPTWHTNRSDTLKLTITVRGLKATLPPWELTAREAVLQRAL